MISSVTGGPIPSVGDAAPDFTVGSTAGAPVTLSSFRGKKNVLLAFFPLAFTSVCTAELCDLSADYDQFASADVEVLPISVDSVPTLKEFRNKYAMKATLLSDFKRDVSRTYGVLIPDKFHSARAYFLVGKDGRVAWRYVEKSTGEKRTNAEILAEINKLG
jgi:mycoredoxin-dependent peroxiredoxin